MAIWTWFFDSACRCFSNLAISAFGASNTKALILAIMERVVNTTIPTKIKVLPCSFGLRFTVIISIVSL